MRTLVIGCGNPNRRDDSAGLLVARRLRDLGYEAIEHTGDGTALLDLWKSADEVILVDAVHDGGEPGTVHTWHTSDAPVGHEFYACSTHHFGVGEAIRLARVFGSLPGRFEILAIVAGDVSIGSEITPQVEAAVEDVVHRLSVDLRERSEWTTRSAAPEARG